MGNADHISTFIITTKWFEPLILQVEWINALLIHFRTIQQNYMFAWNLCPPLDRFMLLTVVQTQFPNKSNRLFELDHKPRMFTILLDRCKNISQEFVRHLPLTLHPRTPYPLPSGAKGDEVDTV